MDIKIGADPEFFLSRDDKFHSGWGIIPGTKRKPFKVDKGAVQLDGFAAEFNIDPANSEDMFVDNVNTVLAELRRMVPPEYKFEYAPVAFFEPEHMADQPPEVLMLGCDPDFNAYTGAANKPPDAACNMRTAAGHVHIGWGEGFDTKDWDHIEACQSVVKQLDVALGIPSVVFDPNKERRAMYGKAGAFRPKPYGVEYRVLSNFWLLTEEKMRWVYTTTMNAINSLLEGEVFTDHISEDDIQHIINTSDVDMALAVTMEK